MPEQSTEMRNISAEHEEHAPILQSACLRGSLRCSASKGRALYMDSCMAVTGPQEVKSVPEPWTLKDRPGTSNLSLERSFDSEKVIIDLMIQDQVQSGPRQPASPAALLLPLLASTAHFPSRRRCENAQPRAPSQQACRKRGARCRRARVSEARAPGGPGGRGRARRAGGRGRAGGGGRRRQRLVQCVSHQE